MICQNRRKPLSIVLRFLFEDDPDIEAEVIAPAQGDFPRKAVGLLYRKGEACGDFSVDLSASGQADEVNTLAGETPIERLPHDCLGYLLGSRYCETDHLSSLAWQLFGHIPPGWTRVQAIVDFVHRHVTFGYQHAHHMKSAHDVYEQRTGVCRDFAHLALTLCRCMGIPARYCTGYLGDIGVPPEPEAMDFSGWFEVYLSGRWYTFDARHNIPRIGRILMGTGRDAADVALTTSFGRMTLTKFVVVTDEVVPAAA